MKPVRSVMIIDDEDWALELVSILLNKYLPGVQILPFMIRDAAWEALTKTPPDLLITDLRDDNVPRRPPLSKMTGLAMLRLLANRKAPFPILVVSGSFLTPGVQAMAEESAGPDLNIVFLAKPYTPELFHQALLKSIAAPSSQTPPSL